jgi:hypothetical protein
MPIRLSNLPLAEDAIVPSGFFPVADLTDMNLTEGMGRTLNIPVSGIYDISIGKNINLKTTNYILSPHDYKNNIVFDHIFSDGIKTLTIPSYSTERINTGYNITIIRANTGDVQIVADNGVNIYSESGLYLKNRHSVAILTKIERNSWILTGDLSKTISV